MKRLPLARKSNLIERQSDDEILIYDLEIDKALCLNKTSATVYSACNGAMTYDELKTQSGLTDEIIFLTLDGLQKHNLLEEQENYLESFGALSRREIIKKAGLSSMVMLPLISTLIAPTAIDAASGGCIRPGQPSNYMRTGIFGPSFSAGTCVTVINAQCCSGSGTRISDQDRCFCYNTATGVGAQPGENATCAAKYTCNP